EPGTLNQLLGHYCPVRYGLCYLTTAALAAMLLLGDVIERLRRLGEAVGGTGRWRWLRQGGRILLLLPAGAVRYPLFHGGKAEPADRLDGVLISVNLVVVGLMIALLVRGRPRLGRWLLLGLVGAALLAWTWSCPRLAESWHRHFDSSYDRAFAGTVFSTLA